MKLHALLIMDKSGSMESIRQEAITHFNEQVDAIRAEARKEGIDADVSLVTFNHEPMEVFWRSDIDDLHSLDPKEYIPNGSTALNDALGNACAKMERDIEDGDRVIVSVVSDGWENASKEWKPEGVKELVQRLSKRNWTFLHLGARQNLGEVAARYGYDPSNVSAFAGNAKGMEMSQGRTRNALRCAVSGQSLGLYADPDSDHDTRWQKEVAEGES